MSNTYAEVLDAQRVAVRAGIDVRDLGSPGRRIINLAPRTADLAKADVDTFRSVLALAGWREVKSWMALEHANWLNDGEQSVSFQIEEKK